MLLFSTDIDGTIYDGPESAALFSDFWHGGLGERLLVYNTGRSLADTILLIEEASLPEPNFLICGVGTVIHDFLRNETLHPYQLDIGRNWNFDIVKGVVETQTAAKPQPPECQNANKCSWFWENASPLVINAVVEEIAQHGVNAQAIYSSNVDLDFVPVGANKGNAVRWLAGHLGLSLGSVVVAGDSGNDARMYDVPGVQSIVVKNAESALVNAVKEFNPFFASEACARGVIEGLRNLRNDVFP